MLRRQYSQQEQPTCRRLSTSDSGVEVSPGQRRIQPQLPQAPYQKHPQSDFISHQHTHPYSSSPQQHSRTLPFPGQSGSVSYQDDTDPRYYQASYQTFQVFFLNVRVIIIFIFNIFQGEIEGLMRSHPHLVHPMQQKYATSAQNPHPAQSHHPSHQMHDLTPKSRHRRHLIGGGPYMPHQRSFSSSEEDIREYEGRIQIFNFITSQ